MKSLLCAIALILVSSAHAGQCYNAYKQSKKLEKIVEGVYFISEADSPWTAFASWKPITEVSEKEIRRVLNLAPTYYGEESFFKMSADHKRAYSFLRDQIENRLDSADEDDEYFAESKKLKKLIKTISRKYGKNVRLVLYGAGDGDYYFSGDHMILIIMDNGCVMGLKADTAWT